MKSASFRAGQPVWAKRAFRQLVRYKCLSKPQRTPMSKANPVKDTYGLTSCLLSALRKSLCVYDSVINSLLNWTFKIRKIFIN